MKIQGDPEQAIKTAIKLWRGWRFRNVGMADDGKQFVELDLAEPCVCEFCGNDKAFEVEGYRIQCMSCQATLSAYNPTGNQWKAG